MSLTAIIAILIAAGGAILGMFGGRALGKSVGIKEGQQQAQEAAKTSQSESRHKAIEERLNANQSAADASDADLDRGLSKYDRAD